MPRRFEYRSRWQRELLSVHSTGGQRCRSLLARLSSCTMTSRGVLVRVRNRRLHVNGRNRTAVC